MSARPPRCAPADSKDRLATVNVQLEWWAARLVQHQQVASGCRGGCELGFDSTACPQARAAAPAVLRVFIQPLQIRVMPSGGARPVTTPPGNLALEKGNAARIEQQAPSRGRGPNSFPASSDTLTTTTLTFNDRAPIKPARR
jgi:hypothetical protein